MRCDRWGLYFDFNGVHLSSMHLQPLAKNRRTNSVRSAAEATSRPLGAQRRDLPISGRRVSRVDTARMGMTNETLNSDKVVARLWTTKDLAKFLGCSERQIPRLRDEGMPTVMVGSLVRFLPGRVVAWLEQRRSSEPTL
jgi:hypothetical protein